VLDLTEQIRVDAYQIPDRLTEQVILRDSNCVFPWCTRTARASDLDHITPYEPVVEPVETGIAGPPGQTSTENLSALCRRHHRLKTFGGWTYRRTGPAAYLWTSPHGYRYLRDHTGSRAVAVSDTPDVLDT
jgi:5-methylcytosine-specific restriction endonuclease McrA